MNPLTIKIIGLVIIVIIAICAYLIGRSFGSKIGFANGRLAEARYFQTNLPKILSDCEKQVAQRYAQ